MIPALSVERCRRHVDQRYFHSLTALKPAVRVEVAQVRSPSGRCAGFPGKISLRRAGNRTAQSVRPPRVSTPALPRRTWIPPSSSPRRHARAPRSKLQLSTQAEYAMGDQWAIRSRVFLSAGFGITESMLILVECDSGSPIGIMVTRPPCMHHARGRFWSRAVPARPKGARVPVFPRGSRA
jgi:hypothetical protein